MTGRYPQRLKVGLQEPLTSKSPDAGLAPDHPTIASLLKANGYDTSLIGKWHLGWQPEFGPNRHGFDEFFGVLSGATDYFSHNAADAPGAGRIPGGGPDLYHDLTPVERTGYLTDLLTDKAVETVSRRRTKPFFLSLHYTAPHAPWEGPADGQRSHTAHGPGPMTAGGSLKTYAAMMNSLDAGIGRVLNALDRSNLQRDTLVIFTSDNGGERFSFHWPFSGQKTDLREGGTRVPAIVRWPGVVPAGRTTDQATITMDWMATILAAARTAADPGFPLDGIDLLPICTGQRTAHDRSLFWRFRGLGAARIGSWKYLNEGKDREQLFDLANDPGERVDLRGENAARVASIREAYRQWNADMLPPVD